MQRGSKIIQVHSGKTNLKEIAASQYGWNLVQGLTNISIKNKIADHISLCQSLSAFTGISISNQSTTCLEQLPNLQYRTNVYK